MATLKRTFQIWIPRYISSIETKNYSENTIEAYGRVLKLFARYKTYLAEHDGDTPENTEVLAGLGMSADVGADALEITDFFTMIRNERHLKPASLHQYDSALSSFYRHLIAQNVVDANPMSRVERPKIKDRELKYLRHKEVMAFIASLTNPRDALLIRTIYATGMRVSEICGLCAEHIDFEEQTIRVRGKGGKIRIVFCDPETLSQIREHLGGRSCMLRRGLRRIRSGTVMRVSCTSVRIISVLCRRISAIILSRRRRSISIPILMNAGEHIRSISRWQPAGSDPLYWNFFCCVWNKPNNAIFIFFDSDQKKDNG